ncbi:hypothetical protein KC19_7G099300 [Ceratodon purpureus]|uniref:MIR domain-containing protein n=1 Tax=Ceratodon purpureus TaxID=3225 RepID=A0A8T0H6T8_CERPU|nr:hypothetical protein KC19_7G099300 [Ceratodon purpureus]
MSSDGELSSTAADLAPGSPRGFGGLEEFVGSASGVRSRPVVAGAQRRELEEFLRRLAEERAGAPPREEEVDRRSPEVVELGSSWFRSVGFLQLTFAMGFLSLALVGLLAIFQSTVSPPVEAAVQGKEVTYGSVIKLQHDRTKYRLHSHDVPYGSGSGQQSVTAFPGVEDANSYWMVEIVDDGHEQGDVIPNGAIVRLQHVRTRKWLHSHFHQSPLSGNLEVSGFGGDEQTDTGDYWKLEIEGKDSVWTLDQKVRLRHVDTNGYLHSHNMKYNQLNQREVCGVTKKNADNLWSAAEGIYFRPKGSSLE